jgi:hypothetical protein
MTKYNLSSLGVYKTPLPKLSLLKLHGIELCGTEMVGDDLASAKHFYANCPF